MTFKSALGLMLAVLLCGCGHVRDAGPVFGALPPAYRPPPRPELQPNPGDCADTVTLLPGESRDCVSLSKAPHVEREDLAELDAYPFTVDALASCSARRLEDRESCNVVLMQREEQLRVARQAQGRVFLAGVGAGVGAVLTGVAVAVAATR